MYDVSTSSRLCASLTPSWRTPRIRRAAISGGIAAAPV
jgi:hypothetical protein